MAVTGPHALAAYRWSSLPVYLERRESSAWLATEPLASMIDARRHITDLTDCRIEDLWPLDGLAPRVRCDLDAIEASVRSTVGAGPDRASKRIDDRIMMMLGLDLRSADVVAIADRFDCSTRHVRREAHRARTLCIDDPTFAARCLAVERSLLDRHRGPQSGS